MGELIWRQKNLILIWNLILNESQVKHNLSGTLMWCLWKLIQLLVKLNNCIRIKLSITFISFHRTKDYCGYRKNILTHLLSTSSDVYTPWSRGYVEIFLPSHLIFGANSCNDCFQFVWVWVWNPLSLSAAPLFSFIL